MKKQVFLALYLVSIVLLLLGSYLKWNNNAYGGAIVLLGAASGLCAFVLRSIWEKQKTFTPNGDKH